GPARLAGRRHAPRLVRGGVRALDLAERARSGSVGDAGAARRRRRAPAHDPRGATMSTTVTRVVQRAEAAWASDRVRLAVLTVYYLAILLGLVAVRAAH